jgi:hypothetical protein
MDELDVATQRILFMVFGEYHNQPVLDKYISMPAHALLPTISCGTARCWPYTSLPHAVQPGLGRDSLEPASNIGLLADPLRQPMLAIDG